MRVVGRREKKSVGRPKAGWLPSLGWLPIAPRSTASALSVRSAIEFLPAVLSTMPSPPITFWSSGLTRTVVTPLRASRSQALSNTSSVFATRTSAVFSRDCSTACGSSARCELASIRPGVIAKHLIVLSDSESLSPPTLTSESFVPLVTSMPLSVEWPGEE